jgi:hypothetical protein
MAHHTLTLNYGPEGFRPDTDVLPVNTGDTISFQLGKAPPKSTFLITMDPKFFSAKEVRDSSTRVKVREAAITTYSCQLFDEAGELLSAKGQPGGGTRPVNP